MSNIEYMFIEGISRIDTPYFYNINEQYQYFSNHLVKAIVDDSYYPPYYENEIKVSAEDLTVGTKVNYLRLYYKDKYYYYFIDDLQYIAEDLISIHITMDTFQSFYFNHKIDSAIIERMFIDRYDAQDKINRNYLRENVSQGDFYNLLKIDYSPKPCYIVKKYQVALDEFIMADGNNATNVKPVTILSSGRGDVQVPAVYSLNFVIPKPTDISAQEVTFKVYTKSGLTYNNCVYKPANTAVDTLTDTNIEKITYFNDIPSSYISIDYDAGTITYDPEYVIPEWDSSSHNFIRGFVLGTCKPFSDHVNLNTNPVIVLSTTNLNVKLSTYINNSINKSKAILFDSKYLTQVLDENYIHLTYGERSGSSSYPLFKYDGVSLYGHKEFDIDSGNRYYYIDSNIAVSKYEPLYLTAVCCTTINSIQQNTDAYRQWKSQNYATLATGIISTGFDILGLWTRQMAGSSSATDLIGGILSKASSYTKKGALRVNAQKRIDAINLAEETDNTETGINSVLKGAQFATSYIGNVVNLKFTPDSIKTEGYANSVVQGFNSTSFILESVVNDFEAVSWFYHRNGFLLNDHYYQGKQGNITGETNEDYQITDVPDTQEGELYEEQMQVAGIVKAISAKVTTGDEVEVSSASIKSVVGNIVTIQFNARSQGETEAEVNISLKYIYEGTIDRLLNYVNNRYYFNVVKLKDIDMTLDLLEPNSIVDDLKSRYEDGMRMWNNLYDIGSTYKYDNVERAYVG